MKKLLFILLLFGCGTAHQEDIIIKEDSLIHDTIFTDDSIHFYQQDSVLRLADEAMQQLEFKEDLRKNMLVQIQQQLQNEKLTKTQIQVLQQQSRSYEEQIKEHHRRDVVRKDSVIYNITYKDTEICKPVYIPDTIIVEVLDTVMVKKLKRKRKRRD